MIDYEILPFAPGMSPFHLKGIAYRGHIEYANKFVPGGATAMCAAFKNTALSFFFQQQFLAASWYDALPILAAWHVCARLSNQPPADFLKVRTRHQASQDIHGVYKLILKIASPETVALRVPRAVGKYFDFGKTDASLVSPGIVQMSQSGLPLVMVPWFLIVGETFLQVALEMAGATGIQIRRRIPEPAGEAHGMALVNIGADVQFDVASK